MTRKTINTIHVEISEIIEDGFNDFVGFCGESWTMTKEEADCLTEPSSAPSEYARGYTDAMRVGLPAAFEFWMEEGGYQ